MGPSQTLFIDATELHDKSWAQGANPQEADSDRTDITASVERTFVGDGNRADSPVRTAFPLKRRKKPK